MFQVYTKTKGATNNGKEYEISMVALHSVNFALDDSINDMLLGVNVGCYCPFDDAVIRVEYEHGSKLYMMQMKYKESKVLSKKMLSTNKNFSIGTYEMSYNEMIKKINQPNGMCQGGKKLSEGISPKDTKIYLCTNAKLECDVNKNEEISLNDGKSELKIKKDENENDILNIIGKSCYIFEKYDDSYDTQANNFYEQFRLLDQQHNVEEAIISRVEKEFGKGHNFNVTSLLNFIIEHFYTNTGNCLLTKQDIRCKIIELILNPYLVNVSNPIKDFANWEVWDDMVSNVDVTIMDEHNLTPGPLLNWLYSKYKAQNEDTHCVEIFQTLNAELKIQPIILHIEGGHSEVLSKIIHHFRDFRYRYIICSEEKLTFTENDFEIFNKLRDVERNDSKNTLGRIEFSLQGRKSISLGKLLKLYPELSNQLRSSAVFELVMETKVIGEILPNKGEPYIKRKFDVTFLDEKIFTETFNDKIIISGGKLKNETICEASESYPNSECPRISYAEEGDVENVATQIKEQMGPPVHFFKMSRDQKLVYVKSWGDVSNLEPYCRRETVTEENITCLCEGRTVNIISAEPGMGKTFLMDSLSHKFKWYKWIFNLKLNKIQHDLSNEEMCNDPAEFFFRHNKKVSELDELMFQSFKSYKNIVFLIDGFDEICPKYEVAARRLIHKLKNDKYQVWITTRPMAQYMLDDTADFLIHLKTFSWKDSMELLTEWKCSEDKVKKVLQKIDRDFITRPLHVKVIKDVVLLNEGNEDWTSYLTSDWYKVFIKKLLVMHYQINRQMDLRINNAEFEMEESIRVVLRKHTFMALILLYGMDDMKKFVTEEELRETIKHVKQMNNNYGLIKDVIDDNPIFVQKTFAEYLTAQWLFDNRFEITKSSDNNNEKIEKMKVLYKKIYEKEFVQVRKLFNELITKELPLHRAILQRKFREVEANIKCTLQSDDLQRTPLHIAVEQLIDCYHDGRTNFISILDFDDVHDRCRVWCNIIEYLLKYYKSNNCIPRTKDVILNLDWLERANDCHNLHVIASSNGSLMLMKILISSATDLEKDVKREESYLQASKYGHLEIIRELHVHMDVTTKEKCLIVAASVGNLNVVKYLVEENTLDIDTKNEYNDTPLTIAVRRDHLNVVRYLTDKGADIHSSTVEGSCLVTAVFRGHLDIVKHLIGCGADVNFKEMPQHNIYCKTPLIAAVEFGYLQIVKELHENGAEVNFRSNCRYSPLFVACRENRIEIIKYLIDAKADVNLGCEYDDMPLIVAAEKGYYDVVRLILEEGGNVNVQNERQLTALHVAADNGHLTMVKLLIEKGANVKMTTKTGATPLHYAAESGHIDVVKSLITLDADVNARNEGNYTPVHYAARWGNLEVIKLLVENKGDVHVRSKEGYTPLMLASSENRVAVVEYLKKLS